MHTPSLLKYPRTPHIEGSRLQAGDDAMDQAAVKSLSGRHVVIEEKLDGANTGISFDGSAGLLLQSRGHYLSGGARERQFNLLKQWAVAQEARLLEVLEDRYVMYGEWTFSKHSVFYDCLPHHFHEFDIFDRREAVFLSTARRQALLQDSPVLPVPVLYAGLMPARPADLRKLLRDSLAKSRQWRSQFEQTVAREGLPLELCWKQTDRSDASEGLYIKVEDDGQVLERYKFVRPDFVQTILDSGSHHSRRPIVPNGLADGVDLYAPRPAVNWEDLGLRTINGLDALLASK